MYTYKYYVYILYCFYSYYYYIIHNILYFIYTMKQVSLFNGNVTQIKKHSSIIQISNIVKLQQRKAFNMFLYIAKETLKKNPQASMFNIDLATLKKTAGIKETNNKEVKTLLESLVNIVIEYNVLNKDQKVWGVFALVSQVQVLTVNNISTVNFAFPPAILDTIQYPSIYTKLDLLIMRDLKSKYSIAMYEILKDYQGIGKINIEL